MVTVWCDGERASEEVVEHGGLVPIDDDATTARLSDLLSCRSAR